MWRVVVPAVSHFGQPVRQSDSHVPPPRRWCVCHVRRRCRHLAAQEGCKQPLGRFLRRVHHRGPAIPRLVLWVTRESRIPADIRRKTDLEKNSDTRPCRRDARRACRLRRRNDDDIHAHGRGAGLPARRDAHDQQPRRCSSWLQLLGGRDRSHRGRRRAACAVAVHRLQRRNDGRN